METVSGVRAAAAAAVGDTVVGFAQDGVGDIFPDSGDGGDAEGDTTGGFLGDSLPRDVIDASAERTVPLLGVVSPVETLSGSCP